MQRSSSDLSGTFPKKRPMMRVRGALFPAAGVVVRATTGVAQRPADRMPIANTRSMSKCGFRIDDRGALLGLGSFSSPTFLSHEPVLRVTRMLGRSSSAVLSLCWFLIGICSPSPALSASPTEQISTFRVSHGLGRVTTDSTLNRIAQEQATAMAARDVLDHDVAGSFRSRMASSRSGRAAENIAYGHDSFSKTLDQWIRSSGHRKNLLMREASRVGVASAKSSKTGRTYWAMVIAGAYDQPKRVDQPKRAAPKAASKARSRDPAPQPCRMRIMGLCL